MTAREYPPGMPAPVAGTYAQRNVLGSFTGGQVSVAQGDALPAAPRGFTWSLLETHEDRDRGEPAGSAGSFDGI
jgi:hypothetical protein